MKYFKGTTFPKFVLYSAHAEEMYPLLSAFDHLLITEAPPASAIFIEFYTEDASGADMVRIVYKDTPATETVLLGSAMTIKKF